LLVELVDELAGGLREAAWPSLQGDLGLSYFQIGILIAAPAVLSGVLEPALGILADTARRRMLVIGGGILFAASLLVTAVSTSFWVLLLSFVLFYPASGAFVSISQAELMDREPRRRDQNMARWTFAGSAGALAGPLALGAAGASLGWRGFYALFAAVSVLILVIAARSAFPARASRRAAAVTTSEPPLTLRTGIRMVVTALRNREVLRWLVLLEVANLMLDILMGFLALYLVKAAAVSPAQAAFAVALWSGSGLLGDFLVIPLLERVPALRYVRLSAAAAAVLYPAFLLAGPVGVKIVLVALLGLVRAGWYAVLQARLYAALPGQSGLVLAVGTVAGALGALIPAGVGALAQAVGLPAAMWTLLAAPVALLIGLPRERGERPGVKGR
jgi:MFS transporter, FSR family, fosmidomycin resistance protein